MSAVRIHAIATGGDGVGRLDDGLTVFVPRTAPGDLVEIQVTRRHARWARGRLRRVVEAGSGRTDPRCPHYDGDACGGCQIQHLAPDAQLTAKATVVRDVIGRVGGRSIPLPGIVPAPKPWRYRTKVTLAVAAGRRCMGFHRYDEPGTVFELEDCPLAAETLVALLRSVRAAKGWLPTGVGQITLRLDREERSHVVVVGGRPPWDAATFAAAFPTPQPTVWWQPEDGPVRAVAGGGGSPVPVLAFQQVNPVLADRIRQDAAAWLDGAAGTVAWDLYGGVGDTARLLAARGLRVWSVDADRTAIAWAQGWAEPDGTEPTYVAGKAEEVLPRLPAPGLVVLNPPRAGAARDVTQGLDRLGRSGGLRRIAYVSCDPATLARDLGRLPSFELRAVTAYDLFPQTAHVEVLALLEAA